MSMELPTDDTGEELILRGRPEDLRRALCMVYELAKISLTEEISASTRRSQCHRQATQGPDSGAWPWILCESILNISDTSLVDR
ncbi:hypothetical protein X801_10167, partial [Opisthorchis viverrini]